MKGPFYVAPRRRPRALRDGAPRRSATFLEMVALVDLLKEQAPAYVPSSAAKEHAWVSRGEPSVPSDPSPFPGSASPPTRYAVYASFRTGGQRMTRFTI